jgi:uncharacterized protein YfkK (UPF0435 family)
MLTLLTQRLQALEDNVCKDLLLLKKYEDALRLEDDPKRQTRYEYEIQQLQESAQFYQREADELKRQISNNASTTDNPSNIDDKIDQITSNLRILQGGQIAILGRLDHARVALLERYDASQRLAIAAITQKLDQRQVFITQTLLNELEANQLSESEIQDIWKSLKKRVLALPPSQLPIAEIIKDPELDAKHKLKISIPIIPFVLDYEGELELGSGLNISTAWEWVKIKLKTFRT